MFGFQILEFKKNSGFTIIELLVIIGITGILTSGIVFYSRTAERQLILFKEQAKIVGILQKAKLLTIAGYGDVQTPCGYGVNFSAPDIITIFKENSTMIDCSDRDNIYTDSTEKYEEIILDKTVKFKDLKNSSGGNFNNIVFIAPEPIVVIDDTLNNNYALIEIQEINNQNNKKIIKVTSGGQVTTQ